MPNFDWTVNFGQVIQAVIGIAALYAAVLRMWHLIDKRIGTLEGNLVNHKEKLHEHGTRMDRYESQIMQLVADLQRVIGRIEGISDRRGVGARREVDARS